MKVSFLLCSQAMKLGTPVIARDIEGNRSLIQHRETGLLYNTPQVSGSCWAMWGGGQNVCKFRRIYLNRLSYKTCLNYK